MGSYWFAFKKFDEALQEVEIHLLRAMPAHEREAKFADASSRFAFTIKRSEMR